MSDGLTSPNDLDAAVSGLAGIVGLLLLPTAGAWLNLVMQSLRADRAVFTRPPRVSGLGLLRVIGLTALLGFFAITLGRAAAELRDVRVEAPVFASTIAGVLVGMGFWILLALTLGTLRREWRRNRGFLRSGGLR